MTYIHNLPPGFLFGAATSAYQIEGGWDADGKGASIWDHYTRQPGRIFGDHTGVVACNTYQDFQTDIAIMRELGLDAYRFSVAWPRVLPDGRGAVNQKGLDYYERLVDALLRVGIAPFVTLFHWDLPHALHREMGGFDSRDCAAIFANYVEIVARRLGDRVRHWITLNEPWVHATFGHMAGNHAPGRRNPWAYLRTVHHQMLGHGLAVERLKSIAPGSQVGISLNLTPFHSASASDADRAAAQTADQIINRLFLDPLFRGSYPEPYWTKLRLFRPKVRPGDMALIARPIDFLGINYYTRARVRYSRLVPLLKLWPAGLPAMSGRDINENGVAYSQMGWEVYPGGLFELLIRIKQEYRNLPVYVTENGAAFVDVVAADGHIHDEPRREYLEQHLAVTSAAARAGIDVRGYFVWSLIDNFEWTHGYNRRFGIVHVDFDSQRRTIKDSGYWYADLIKRQKAAWAMTGEDAAGAGT